MDVDGRFECFVIPGTTSSQGKYVDPPTSVTASAGNAQATVSFTLPVYDGKGTATYQGFSTPQAIVANGASSPITFTGLSNGTSYTFNVQTISGYGVSANSASSNAVTPTAPAPSFGPSFPSFPSFPTFPVCPQGTYFEGNCYYNCGTGSSSCACGPGQPTGYVAPNGTVDCFYAYP